MAADKFGRNDTVRLIGTDAHLTVKQYNERTYEYQVQRGNDAASMVWVLGIYLELVGPGAEPARRNDSAFAACTNTMDCAEPAS